MPHGLSMTVLKLPPISSFKYLGGCPMISNNCFSLYCQEYCIPLLTNYVIFFIDDMWVGLHTTSQQLFQRWVNHFYQVSGSSSTTIQKISSKEGLPISLGPGMTRHCNSLRTTVAPTNMYYKQISEIRWWEEGDVCYYEK